MKGLRQRDRGLVSFWGCLVYLKGPVRNIRHAAFLHRVLTAPLAILKIYGLVKIVIEKNYTCMRL
jgi:hypothetical protein